MKDIYDKIDILLDAERTALMEGDLARIPTLTREKEALIQGLEARPEEAESLRLLQGKISRNHVLFDSALIGIRAAVSRLGSVNTVSHRLDTYAAKGQRQSIDLDNGATLEKRA